MTIRARWSRRRLVGAGIVLGVAVVATAAILAALDSNSNSSGDDRGSPSRSASPGESADSVADLDFPARQDSAVAHMFERRAEDGVTTQLALDSFATLLAPIPGGTAIPGELPPFTSATPAVRWMLGQWDELSDEQRDVFWEVVYGEERANRDLGASGEGRIAPVRLQARDLEVEAEMEARVAEIADEFNRLSGLAFPELTVNVETTNHPDNWRAASTYGSFVAPGPRGGSECVVTFYPPASDEFDIEDGSVFDEFADEYLEMHWERTAAHELYHCHQYYHYELRSALEAEDVLNEVAGAPSWVIEASASWAGEWYLMNTDRDLVGRADRWEDYLDWPSWRSPRSLFDLDYNALGFYASLYASISGSPDPPSGGEVVPEYWETLDDMVLATPQNQSVFGIAVDNADADFLARWAMSTFQDPGRGPEWVVSSANVPESARPEIVADHLEPGDRIFVETARDPGVARSNMLIAEDVDVIELNIQGTGGLNWGNFEFYDILGGGLQLFSDEFEAPPSDTETFSSLTDTGYATETRWYCLSGDCGCLEGNVDSADEIIARNRTTNLTVALTGGDDHADLAATGHELDDLCDRANDGELLGDTDPEQVVMTRKECERFESIVQDVLGDEDANIFLFSDEGTFGATCGVHSVKILKVESGNLFAATFSYSLRDPKDCLSDDVGCSITQRKADECVSDDNTCSWSEGREVGITNDEIVLTMTWSGGPTGDPASDTEAAEILGETYTLVGARDA